MRTTLDVADDVLAAAREIAHAEGRSIGAVISDLARRALAPATPARRRGFPVFDVSRNAPVITTEDVQRALDDE